MANLGDLEGIGPDQLEKLRAQGLHTTEDMLKAGATPKTRGELAGATAISEKLILRWVNMADLFRINGVAEQYADLLEASGVDTVPELAQRNPVNLLAKMMQVNEERKLVQRVPTEEQVRSWVAEAQTLPRMVSYGGAYSQTDRAAHSRTESQTKEPTAAPVADTSGLEPSVPQAETAGVPVLPDENNQVDVLPAGAGTESSGVGGSVPPQGISGAPRSIAGEAQKQEAPGREWWGARLWRALRG